jgi:hypothetical protein
MTSATIRVVFALAALAFPAVAQSVISTHSGVVHFFEGEVFVGDQPLEAHLGKFPMVPKSGALRTGVGRAEVLLTPGVFLRLGQESSIRMVANDLTNTQVELLSGSAMVDSGEANADTSVTLIYKDWRVHFLQKGVYRIDSDPPRLWVRQGQAEVLTGEGSQPVAVEQGMSLPFASVLVPDTTNTAPSDAFNDWSTGRSQSIIADNAITSQIDEDPDSRPADADTFSYFPFLGVPTISPDAAGVYSAYAPYQPGFSSIYLPGYTYRPLIIGLVGNGYRSYGSVTRPRITGSSPGISSFSPTIRAPFPTRVPIYSGRPSLPGAVRAPLPGAVRAPLPGAGTSLSHPAAVHPVGRVGGGAHR